MDELRLNPRVVEWIKNYATKNFPEDNDPHPNNIFAASSKDFKGILGELVIVTLLCRNIFEYLMARPVGKSDYGYDIWWDGRKWDIKTLLSVVKPFSGYRYNVAEVQAETAADGFIFCTVLKNLRYGYCGGYIEKDEFMKKAIFHKKGTRVEANGFVFPCNAYDIGIEHLKDLQPD